MCNQPVEPSARNLCWVRVSTLLSPSWCDVTEIIGNPVCLVQVLITSPTGLLEASLRAAHKSSVYVLPY